MGSKSDLPNVSIVMAVCSKTKKHFGIRLEERSRKTWVATWAFPLKESAGKREGYDKTKITGTFYLDFTYPGCPHCEAKTFTLSNPAYCTDHFAEGGPPSATIESMSDR